MAWSFYNYCGCSIFTDELPQPLINTSKSEFHHLAGVTSIKDPVHVCLCILPPLTYQRCISILLTFTISHSPTWQDILSFLSPLLKMIGSMWHPGLKQKNAQLCLCSLIQTACPVLSAYWFCLRVPSLLVNKEIVELPMNRYLKVTWAQSWTTCRTLSQFPFPFTYLIPHRQVGVSLLLTVTKFSSVPHKTVKTPAPQFSPRKCEVSKIPFSVPFYQGYHWR